MKAISIQPTNSKSIKRLMILSGIKVLRCIANNRGLIITVANTTENRLKAEKFMLEYSLTRSNGDKPAVISTGVDHADYGNVFHTSVG